MINIFCIDQKYLSKEGKIEKFTVNLFTERKSGFRQFYSATELCKSHATSGFQLLTRKKKAILKIITKSMIKAIKNEKKNFKHVFTIIFFKICSTFVNVLSVLYGDLDVWITLASIEKIFSQSLFS